MIMVEERESGASLFERIKDAATSPVRRKPKEALLHSVRNTLRNILNTRSGSCYGSPELGLTDFNDDALISSDFRKAINIAITNCVLRYEPRISDVRVTAAVEDCDIPLELRFHIVAMMVFSDRKEVLEFEILLDNRQHWHVEPT